MEFNSKVNTDNYCHLFLFIAKDPSSFTGGHSITDYQIHVLNTVGEGMSLTLFSLLHLIFATSYHKWKGEFGLSSMMDEILKMQDFHHPHVMTLIGVSFDANHTLDSSRSEAWAYAGGGRWVRTTPPPPPQNEVTSFYYFVDYST